MAQPDKALRQSVSLPSPIARRIRALAKRENRSSSRVIVDLIEAGLEAKEQEKRTFYELADRLTTAADASEQKRLKRELARITYGE
jgi:predicted DNA-binding protein